jgi:RNA polymerase sigma-70 factor (ECF subfamily)
MASETSFAEFIQRIRGGDAQAAEELVRKYEPAIRMEVRTHLSDPRLGRVFDSMDVCQSVLASFFLRAANGQYELNEPGQLIRLLVAMARNKLKYQIRKHRAKRRDHRRAEVLDPAFFEPAGSEPSPSQMVAGEELLQEFRRRLTEEERRLADQRALGREWADIAAEMGGTPQARRKQLERAISRVARELGLDEPEQ